MTDPYAARLRAAALRIESARTISDELGAGQARCAERLGTLDATVDGLAGPVGLNFTPREDRGGETVGPPSPSAPANDTAETYIETCAAFARGLTADRRMLSDDGASATWEDLLASD